MGIKVNMSVMDRGLRILLGLILIYTGFINTQLIGNAIVNYLIGGFGLLNLISAIVGFCPVYSMAHINTRHETE